MLIVPESQYRYTPLEIGTKVKSMQATGLVTGLYASQRHHDTLLFPLASSSVSWLLSLILEGVTRRRRGQGKSLTLTKGVIRHM